MHRYDTRRKKTLERTTGRIGTTNELIWWTRKRDLERTTVRIKNEQIRDKEDTGKNLQIHEDAWEDLDTWERRDHEPIKDHLHEASVKLESDNWKLRMNNPEIMDSGWQTEKTLEYLLMGEKDSHNRKQLWEDVNKLAPWILTRIAQD